MKEKDISVETITQKRTWIESGNQETITIGIITRITKDQVI